jgi:hypothetical protein
MTVRNFCLSAMALAAVLTAPALAKQGKVGLWNVTSTTDMALPPRDAATMKAAGQSLPAAKPVTVQMCMSQAEVDSSQPPHLDPGSTGCTTRTTKQTASEMTAVMSCNGNMKGGGNIRITYTGNEHYVGSYTFKGTSFGAAANITTNFKGDWVKADCGKVQPYKLRTQ